MANRTWKVIGAFHRVGELAVIVTAPNWQSAIRKAALEIKRMPVMRRRRMNVASFTLQEIDAVHPLAEEANEQLQVPAGTPAVAPAEVEQVEQVEQRQSSTTPESEE